MGVVHDFVLLRGWSYRFALHEEPLNKLSFWPPFLWELCSHCPRIRGHFAAVLRCNVPQTSKFLVQQQHLYATDNYVSTRFVVTHFCVHWHNTAAPRLCVCFGVAMLCEYRLTFFLRKFSRKVMVKKTNPESVPPLRYDYKVFSVELGKRIRQLRKESGLTLRALIVQHGLHLTQIQRIEKGNGISVPLLLRVAQIFQLPLEDLVADLGKVPENIESRSETSK
ncbi:MAG: helix-turn-helix domain-containing protein [Janthinobacterium lividum]